MAEEDRFVGMVKVDVGDIAGNGVRIIWNECKCTSSTSAENVSQ